MRVDGAWKDLETAGFVVVRGLLDAAEIEKVLKPFVDYFGEETWGPCPVRPIPGGPDALALLQGAIRRVLPRLREETDLDLSVFDPLSAYFANTKDGAVGWHQDSPPYLLFGKTYRYVNFWVPLLKPNEKEAGVCVVPMDRLRAADPEAWDALHHGGYASFAPKDWIAAGTPSPETTYARIMSPGDDDRLIVARGGELLAMKPKFDVNEIAVAPALSAGDALLVRGDVLHRTQDEKPFNGRPRVAISARIGEELPITKSFLLRQPELVRKDLAHPEHPLAPALFGAFDYFGRDEITSREAIDFLFAVRGGDPERASAVDAIRAKIPAMLGVTEFHRIT